MNKKVITVSREFGSGGRTIAKQIAQRLGYAYYDRELVVEIAKESGLAESFVLESGEYACSTNSFLYSLAINTGIGSNSIPISDQLYVAQHKVITELAKKESCVIVGRCANYILRDRTDCLHTFLHASIDFRADRVVRLYGEAQDKPEKRLKEKDDKRKAYYKHYTGQQWGVAQNYHISLDTSAVGIERCVDIVVDLAKSE